MPISTFNLSSGPRRMVLLAIGAAMLAGAILWATGIGQSKAGDPSTAPRGIAVLNEPATPASALLPKQRDAVATIGRLEGVDVSQLHVAAPGVWVASAEGETCLLAENSEGIAASCGSNAEAEAGKLTIDIRSTTSDARETIGLVSDDVEVVSARSKRGTAVDSVAVTNNVFRVKGTALATLNLSGPSLKRTVELAD